MTGSRAINAFLIPVALLSAPHLAQAQTRYETFTTVQPVVTSGYELGDVTIEASGSSEQSLVDTADPESGFFVEPLNDGTAVVHINLTGGTTEFVITDGAGRPFLTFETRDGDFSYGSSNQPNESGNPDISAIADWMTGLQTPDHIAAVWNNLPPEHQAELDDILLQQYGIDVFALMSPSRGLRTVNDTTDYEDAGISLLQTEAGDGFILSDFGLSAELDFGGEQWAAGVAEAFACTADDTPPEEQETGPTIRVIPFGEQAFENHLPIVTEDQPFTVIAEFPAGQRPTDANGNALDVIEVEVGTTNDDWFGPTFVANEETITLRYDTRTDSYISSSGPISVAEGGEDASWGGWWFNSLSIDNSETMRLVFGNTQADVTVYDTAWEAELEFIEFALRTARANHESRLMIDENLTEEQENILRRQISYIDHYFVISGTAAVPLVTSGGTLFNRPISSRTMLDIARGYAEIVQDPVSMFSNDSERGDLPGGFSPWRFQWTTQRESATYTDAIRTARDRRVDAFDTFRVDLAWSTYEALLETTWVDNVMIIADASPTAAPNTDGTLQSTSLNDKVLAGIDLGFEGLGMFGGYYLQNNVFSTTTSTRHTTTLRSDPLARRRPCLSEMDGGNWNYRASEGTTYGYLTVQQTMFQQMSPQLGVVPTRLNYQTPLPSLPLRAGGTCSAPGALDYLPGRREWGTDVEIDFDSLPPIRSLDDLPRRSAAEGTLIVDPATGRPIGIPDPSGSGRVLEIGHRFNNGSFATVHGVGIRDTPDGSPRVFQNRIVKIIRPTPEGIDIRLVDALSYRDLTAAVDPRLVEIPKIRDQFIVDAPGTKYDGALVQLVDKAPAAFSRTQRVDFDRGAYPLRPDQEIAFRTIDGEMTPGQLLAYDVGMNELHRHGFALIDNHQGNYTFREIGEPGSDQWILVLQDYTALRMDSPEAAYGIRLAIDSPPPYVADTSKPWARDDRGGASEARLNFHIELANQYDDMVRWDYIENQTGLTFDSLGRVHADPDNFFYENWFQYNPKNGRDYPELGRYIDRKVDAETRRGGLDVPMQPVRGLLGPNQTHWFAEDLNIPSPSATGIALPTLGGQFIFTMPGRIVHVDANEADEFMSSINGNLAPFFTGSVGFPSCPYATDASCNDSVAMFFSIPGSCEAEFDELLGDSAFVQYFEQSPARIEQVFGDDPVYQSAGSWNQDADDQWAIKRAGLAPNDDIDWDSSLRDGSTVTVAIIDTGIAWNHEDFDLDRLWYNPGETPGNLIDDDGNGYVDDIVGWNFVDNTNIPWDMDGHGTLVASIIGATTGNSIGISGINPNARIMVLQALDSMGRSNAAKVTEAIVYAADNGARVINLSVGGRELTRTEQQAIDYAHEKGALIVAAAGNEAIELSDYAPAGADRVLTVAATDYDDQRLASSNWGGHIDIAAPGVDVVGIRAPGTDLMAKFEELDYQPGSNFVDADALYYRATGTSFAAPIVSGVASLLLSARPELTNTETERMLEHSARDIDSPGVDQYTGYGLLDATAAFNADPEFFVEALISGVSVIQDNGETLLRVLGTANADDFAGAAIFVGEGEDPDDWTEVLDDIDQSVDDVLGDLEVQHFAGSQVWTLRVVVEHENGRQREARFILRLG